MVRISKFIRTVKENVPTIGWKGRIGAKSRLISFGHGTTSL